KAAENEKLTEDLADREAENEKLAEDLAQKEAENEKLAEDLAEREAENEKLAKELLERDVYLEGLQTDTSRSLGCVESRCRALEELVAARDAAAALEVDVLEGELAEALVQLKVVESENAALHVLLGVKNAEMAEVNEAALGNVRELESRLAAAEAEVREERGKQEKLMSTTQGALRAMGEENQRRVEQLRADYDEVHAAMQAELAAHREMRAARINARLSHPGLCHGGPPQLPPPRNDVPIEPEVLRYEPVYSVTLEEFTETRESKYELEQNLAQKAAENEKLAEDLAEREAENEKLAEDLAEREAENEKLAEDLAEREAENEKLAEDLAEREAENEKLAKELLERDVYLEGLQTDTSRSLGCVESRCRALEELVAARDAAAALEVDVLEGELAEALVQLKVVESENAALHVLLGVK
ncbi:myosin heavy chain, partial [Trypanosoma rangeli]